MRILRFWPSSQSRRFIALGNRARDAQDWESAAEHYRTALTLEPGNGPIWVQCGHVLKESGRHARAEAAYRRAVELDPNSADAHLQLGILLRLQGRKEEAAAPFQRALGLDATLSPTAEDLAEFGWTTERVEELRRSFVPSPAPPRRRPSLITLADRARDLGQWDAAAGLYRKALRRNPRRPEIWVQYGHMLKETGQVAEAESAYRQALIHDRRASDTHLQLGHVLKLQGRTDEARAAYLRSFVFDPATDHPLTELAGLGWQNHSLDELRRVCSPDDELAATGA
jgi:Flp pilus assembly protein TadD